jgi:Mrp family chromosome partitioning ATPase
VEVPVLVACWSVKGGVGTTVVAASIALQHALDGAPGVVLADLAGDLPAVLGLAEPESPGLAGWLAAGPGVPADALARIEVEAAPGLALLPRGDGPLQAPRAAVLAAMLERSPRTAVVDCGRAEGAVAGAVIERAQQSLLVTRPCFVALRRASLAPYRPTGVVVVNEPGRVLSKDDVEQVVHAPATQIEIDPAVARLVDAGLLTGRIPRSLHALRDAA